MSNSETDKASTDGGDSLSSGWKTTLCQFYIQGNCNKSTDLCNFAHGTSDLRTPEGNPIGFEPTVDKYKSTLCAKFLSIGSCPFGVACRFARGVRELRKPKNKNNPLFKTTLCKLFSESGFCPNAVNCQFAHGVAELRSKPIDSFELESLSPEERQRRLEKAKNTPGYKTKICSKYREHNHCEFGELCHFIHGNEVIPGIDLMHKNDNSNKFDATYKTTMCRKIMSKEMCEYGSKCRFAHSESELRKPLNVSMNAPHNTNYHNSLAFKTVLCSNYTETGQCKYGDNCQFAHGSEQLRLPQPLQANIQQQSIPPISKFSGNSPSVLYKTTMCANIRNKIPCPHGPSCLFAHSNGELRSPMQNISVNTYSTGNKPPMCQSLRVYGGGYSCYSIENSSMPLGSNAPRTYGIQLSSHMNNSAKKTAMCRHIQFNGICPRGNQCTFAHSHEELQGKQDDDKEDHVYFKRPGYIQT
uniref:RING finger protein unkempt n=1 Tax=Lepeophtheirus salmonis TaxID=72036 RepID=C1BUU3_LEPSM|nr:RING finger protein unkempt [Lepeophtheirus salmonis]